MRVEISCFNFRFFVGCHINHFRSSSFDWFRSMSRAFFVMVNSTSFCAAVFPLKMKKNFDICQISHIFSPFRSVWVPACALFFTTICLNQIEYFHLMLLFPCPQTHTHMHALSDFRTILLLFCAIFMDCRSRVLRSRKSISAAIDMFQ